MENYMRKKFSCIVIAAIILVSGIIATYLYSAVRNTTVKEAKAPISLENFWETEGLENTNVLQFVTGLKVVLPEEWAGKVVFNTDIGPEYDPYVNTLAVCEKTNNAKQQCGVLFYLELFKYEKGNTSYTMSKVLGIYKQGDNEYVLTYMEPHDLQYIEGDEEKKTAYEELFSQIEEIQIVTESMAGFTPCTIDDLEWLRDEAELD